MTDLTARELLVMFFEIAQQAIEDRVDLPADADNTDSINLAMLAVHEAAKFEGLNSFIHQTLLQGDFSEIAKKLYSSVENAEAGVHIWCSDIKLNLPGKTGVGGRNQALALRFAQIISSNADLHLLAASMDGIDGNSNCAGAVVSMYTTQKAEKMGFDIDLEIEKANAGLVLMATDDLLSGAQKNKDKKNMNTKDLVIVYKTCH